MAEERSKRVLYVSPLPPPRGGIATWTQTLVLRGLPGGYQPAIVDTSIGDAREIFRRGSLRDEIRRATRILLRFGREVLTERPALVHLNVDPLAIGLLRDLLCGAMARTLRIPVVVHYRGLVSELGEGGRSLQRWAVRRAARLATLNLALNGPSVAYLLDRAGAKRVLALPNYYDEEQIPAARIPRRAPSEPARVLFVGGLTRAKGVAEILDVARENPDVEFRLVGAPHRDTQALLQQPPGNLQILGEIGHDAVLREMSRCHVLLLPTRREGFPNVVCEAMATGLPVIASPVGAIPEMIEDGRGGRIVPPVGDLISTALRSLLESEDRRLAMGEFNRDKSRRLYSYARVVQALCDRYDDILQVRVERQPALRKFTSDTTRRDGADEAAGRSDRQRPS